MRIIFMGTPQFAVPALTALLASKHEVIAIYTKPPKPAGRGYKEIKTIPHQLADQNDIPVYTPKNFKDEADIKQFQILNADVAVVAAYGLLLPKSILEAPRLGCINIHPSALPRWRGAAPIHHTILAGDKATEVCIMRMDEGLDTGDVYMRTPFEINESMTTGQLHDVAANLGAEMTLQVLDMLESGAATPIRQIGEGATYAHKLTREHERIDWERSAFEICCQIRAFSPKPCAYFVYQNEIIKIIAAEYGAEAYNCEAGTVLNNELEIACRQGTIRPLILQREGKKAMPRDTFLRGYEIKIGTILR